MAAPPGVSAADFTEALVQFKAAVGPDWVFTSDEDVALYRDAYSPLMGEPDERVASAAVAPASVEEVQAVVKIANAFKVPLYPISTGRNLGYGGSAPVLSGSVVLDLKRMNRILEVDERTAFALVEPGVSYFDLYRYIQDKGLKLWIDAPDPGWGSLIGNALDHGAGQTAGTYRDHFASHCGMEVVLGNGELVRTGMGAMPGAKTWQQHKYGFGPWLDGMFSQSNFGVVTKMGFWLMPAPEAYLAGEVSVPGHKDIIPLTDILNELENGGICNGFPRIGSPVLSAFGPVDPQLKALQDRPGGPDPQALEAYGRAKGLPYWTLELPFYGPEEVVAAQWAYAKRRFSGIAGAIVQDGPTYRLPLTAEQQEKVHKVVFGIPNLSIFSIGARSAFNPSPTTGHVWFSPIIPRTGEAVLEAQEVLFAAASEVGIPLSAIIPVPQANWLRTWVFLIGFPVMTDVETNRRNREAFRKLVRACAERGWGEYRTAPIFMDEVADTYSFNNHALRRLHETIKDAVDPNGVLSAGRYGIWPRHLRKGRA